MSMFECLLCIFCILIQNMLNRIGPCWTLCVFISPTTTGVILSCTPPSSSGIHSTRVTRVSHHGRLCRGNRSRPIARTWCLSARLGYLMGRFSSGWKTYGSANFCSCSKSIQRQTLACSTTSAPMFQYFFAYYFAYFPYCFTYSSILFDIFNIFCILQYAEYAEYEPCTIFLHILLHILHIVLHTAAYYLTYSAFSAYCRICRIWTLHYFLAYYWAYCAYYFAYICINMQNNMQTPKSICRIVQGS